jgi:hypothetical protein
MKERKFKFYRNFIFSIKNWNLAAIFRRFKCCWILQRKKCFEERASLPRAGSSPVNVGLIYARNT